ncbi:MAG: hypothetical protein QM699_09075 [Amaricoccus sp.]|uniref:hypothetical protein n=1 Tax=Amaricoccus sp. TaxID=1872485 RepID=UPI0039E5EDD8
MATYTAHSAVDMSSVGVDNGGTSDVTDDGVTVTSGTSRTDYGGEIYFYGTEVCGTLRSVAHSEDSALQWEVTGFSRDVHTFNAFLLDGDGESAMG